MTAFDRFIPIDRRSALSRHVEMPPITTGVGLFADISGFTTISEVLTEKLGPHYGAEEITACLNRIYEDLVRNVHLFGGSIICFSGDAITCWFDGDDGDRATACSVSMRKAMRAHEVITFPEDISIALGIKIAVASGTAHRFVVGDPSIQKIDVLIGGALAKLTLIEKLLKRDEVGLEAALAKKLSEQVDAVEWREATAGISFAVVGDRFESQQTSMLPVPQAVGDEIAGSWLLPPVHERLKQNQVYPAELRSATVFFLNFHIADKVDSAEIENHLDAFIRKVQAILNHYGGFLHQISVGDKGSYLCGSFGVPIAHEDDASRCVAAALELHKVSSEMQFIHNIRIGITFGEMYAGVYGGSARYTFGVIGNEVNIASRLMDKAGAGQTLTTGRIKRMAETQFNFSSVGTRWLKGVKIPLEVFSVDNRKSTFREFRLSFGFSDNPMFDRDEEKAIITECVRELESGKGGSAVVEGEAGIGKSRILEYLIKQSLSHGLFIFVSTCEAVERNTPYYVWRDIFRDVFGLRDTIQSAAAREIVLNWIGDDTDILDQAPLINDVLGLDWPDNALTRQMRGDVRAANTRNILLKVLEKHQRNKTRLALILDDVQWMDSASWDLLLEARGRIQPQLQVIALRPLGNTVSSAYEKYLEAEEVKHLHVNKLAIEATIALVRDCLDVEEVSSDIMEIIADRAGGNPFFSQELCFALRDRGLLATENGRCSLSSDAGSLDSLALPDTLQGLLTSRIDRLTPIQQSILKTCSVIGRTFSVQTLLDVHQPESERTRIDAVLINMERINLIQSERQDSGRTYFFRQALSQQVAYDLMLFAQRRELHERLANWHEKTQASGLIARYSILAHHWKRAGNAHKSQRYYQKAGESALGKFANRDAIEFFNEALSLVNGNPNVDDRRERARLEFGLGQALTNTFQPGAGHLETALDLLNHGLPASKLFQVAKLLGQVFRQLLRRTLPAIHRQRSSDGRQVLLESARAYEKLTEVYYLSKETLLTLIATLMALNLAEAAGPSAERCRGYVTAGTIMGFIPLRKAADAYIRRALEEIKEIDDSPALAYINMAASAYYIGAAAWGEADRLLNESIQISERIGDRERKMICTLNLAFAKLFQGAIETSSELSDYVCERSEKEKSIAFLINGLEARSAGMLRLGRIEDALDNLRKIPPLFSEESTLFAETDQLVTYGLLGLAYLKKADYEDAYNAALQAVAYGKKTTPDNYGFFWGFAGPTEVFLGLLEKEYQKADLKKMAKQACRRMSAFARVFPVGRPRHKLLRGILCYLDGKSTTAFKEWEGSLSIAEELEMPFETGLACYEIGRHIGHSDPRRREYLSRAKQIFLKLGADKERQKVETLV